MKFSAVNFIVEPICIFCRGRTPRMLKVEVDINWTKNITIENHVRYVCYTCLSHIQNINFMTLDDDINK